MSGWMDTWLTDEHICEYVMLIGVGDCFEMLYKCLKLSVYGLSVCLSSVPLLCFEGISLLRFLLFPKTFEYDCDIWKFHLLGLEA